MCPSGLGLKGWKYRWVLLCLVPLRPHVQARALEVSPVRGQLCKVGDGQIQLTVTHALTRGGRYKDKTELAHSTSAAPPPRLAFSGTGIALSSPRGGADSSTHPCASSTASLTACPQGHADPTGGCVVTGAQPQPRARRGTCLGAAVFPLTLRSPPFDPERRTLVRRPMEARRLEQPAR